jgi:hypothetical protein
VEGSANSAARHRDVVEYIRDEPLTALAIASMTGFVLGGGVNRRIGLAMLTIVGRIALRGVATSLIFGMVTGSNADTKQDSARPDGGIHDNGRTEFHRPG